VGEDEADPRPVLFLCISGARSLMAKLFGDVVGISGQELEIMAIS